MILKGEIKDFLGSRARLTQTALTEDYWIKIRRGFRDADYFVKERSQEQSTVT